MLTSVSTPWIARPVARASSSPMPRLASATATAPLPTPKLPGVIGNAEATSRAGRMMSAASMGCGRPNAAADRDGRAETRELHADRPAERRSRVLAASGEARRRRRAPARCAGGCAVALESDRDERERADHARRGRTPARPASPRSRAGDDDQHRRAPASGLLRALRRRRRRSRGGRARRSPASKRAILTASPSFAGANELTIEPIAEPCRGLLRADPPPAARER